MWGRMSTVDRDTKFGVAREAIRRTLPKLAPQTRFGLAAFGHRRKADCNDTEIILAPEPLDADRIMARVTRDRPIQGSVWLTSDSRRMTPPRVPTPTATRVMLS